MGIRLTIDRSVRRVPLIGGAGLTMRPASSIEISAAEAAARQQLDAALAGVDALRDLGIPVPDAADLEDPHYVLGLSRYLVGCELAARLVTDWDGIFADGNPEPSPLPFDRAHLPKLLLDDRHMRRFEVAAYSAQEAIVIEGNGSPPSPSGSPAGEANTARAAGPKVSPARPGESERAATAAPKSSTARAPRKA